MPNSLFWFGSIVREASICLRSRRRFSRWTKKAGRADSDISYKCCLFFFLSFRIFQTTMPLPDHPFTVNGGCGCGSIRYRLSIPQFEERPLSMYCDEHAISEKVRFPQVMVDHCNDCRRATGSLTNFWIATSVPCVEFSIQVQGASEKSWIEGNEILKRENLGSEKSLAFRWYRSSSDKFRGFCENCGTNLCYRSSSLPESWPDMVDFLLGTIDRDDLEKDWFIPEREMWWEMGIPWVQDLVRAGTTKHDMPRHPLWKMNYHVPT